MKGLFTGLLFLGLLVYAGYTGFMALQRYLELSNVLDETVQRELPKVSGRGWRPADRQRRVQGAIVESAKQTGIELDRDDIAVEEQRGVLNVRVTYRYPLLRYGGGRAITVPLSAAQSFSVPGER